MQNLTKNMILKARENLWIIIRRTSYGENKLSFISVPGFYLKNVENLKAYVQKFYSRITLFQIKVKHTHTVLSCTEGLWVSV